MKNILLTVSAIALLPAAASAQLVGGGGGLGGSLGGTLNSTIGSSVGNTVDSTTRTIRGTISGSASSEGSQSIDARNGRVSADRNANGSVAGSTASLANLPIPSIAGAEASASGSGQASGEGRANAQLIGSDSLVGAVSPIATDARGLAQGAAATTTSTAGNALASAPSPSLPAVGNANAEGSTEGSGVGSLASSPLTVAGSMASAAQGAATVAPGMPVMTPDGASLGKVREIVATGRGEVEHVVVQQGKVTRVLPAGMFSANGHALIAGEAQGEASGANNSTATSNE